MLFPFGARPIFRGKLAVNFREGMIKTKKKNNTRFPWNNLGFSFQKATDMGARSCEVAIILLENIQNSWVYFCLKSSLGGGLNSYLDVPGSE